MGYSPVMKKYKIAITTGDPAGIGPEIACKFASSLKGSEEFEPVFISYDYILKQTYENILKTEMPDI